MQLVCLMENPCRMCCKRNPPLLYSLIIDVIHKTKGFITSGSFMQETSVFLHHNIAGAVPIGENALQGERYSKHSSRMRKARLPIVSRMSGVVWGWVTTPWTYPRTPERTYHPLWAYPPPGDTPPGHTQPLGIPTHPRTYPSLLDIPTPGDTCRVIKTKSWLKITHGFIPKKIQWHTYWLVVTS